jgi:hypothetical protein
MKTTYLVWKDPASDGANPDWQELTGQEFLALVRSDEGKGRYFVRLDSTAPNAADGAMVMEATKAYFDEWKREKNRSAYMRGLSKDFTTLSYHCLETDDGSYGEELLRDESADTEDECLRSLDKQTLAAALSVLTEDEYRLIAYLYLSDGKGTERSYSELTGIPQKTINDRKKRILEKLKKFF